MLADWFARNNLDETEMFKQMFIPLQAKRVTERKNPHAPVFGVKEFVCQSLFDLSSNQNQKPFEKKLATLAARAVFVNLFFPSKTANL